MPTSADQDRMKRGRGFALLLAFLYGIMTGGAFAPTPVQAHPLAVSIVRDGQSALAITINSGIAALKAQRATPDPILLPELPVERSRTVLRRAEDPESLASFGTAATAVAVYRARAPPAL